VFHIGHIIGERDTTQQNASKTVLPQQHSPGLFAEHECWAMT